MLQTFEMMPHFENELSCRRFISKTYQMISRMSMSKHAEVDSLGSCVALHYKPCHGMKLCIYKYICIFKFEHVYIYSINSNWVKCAD